MRGHRRRDKHMRGRGHGFSFDVFLTKMIFRCFIKSFYLLIHRNDSGQYSQVIIVVFCKQARKRKNTI